jgi:AsmA-like C-terminal region
MRLGRRLMKAVIWGLVLCLSILGGALWCAYRYATDGDTLAQLIKEHAIRFFPRSILDPGRVHFSLFGGKLSFRELRMIQRIDGAPFELLRIPSLSIRIDAKQLTKGQLEMHEVVVSQPTLRLRRRPDGTWNLDGLLADPWPGPWIETPPIVIQKATLELIPDPDEESITESDTPKLPESSSPSGTRTIPVSASGPESGPSSSSSRQTASAGSIDNPGPAVLRDVYLEIKGAGGGPEHLQFEGTARGDTFEKVRLNGTVNLITGSITLEGELSGLNLSENLRRRVPREARPAVKALALNNGLVDVELKRFCYDPAAPVGSRMTYQAAAHLREGVWECPKLPFSVNELSADVAIENGILSIKRAQGANGLTILRAAGTIGLGDPARLPLDLQFDVTDLELDQRLRNHSPAEYDELWDVFQPRGRVDANVRVSRGESGKPVDLSATIVCRDVAAVYRHFQYPLDHLTGRLTLEKNTIAVNLQTLKGAKPLSLTGTIENPGVDAVVRLDIQAEAIPIDDALKRAMPANVRKVVDQFNPSGVVKARAKVARDPLPQEQNHPEGKIAIDAKIDLTERCEVTWVGLPYPIRNLTGRLEIHPENWTFNNMRGTNGLAKIRASGHVVKLPIEKLPNGEDPLEIKVKIEADGLPFSEELRDALPRAWRKSWPTINPSGSCDVLAEVHVAPGQPDHTHIEIVPRPESNARLEVTRAPQPGSDPGGTIEIPMENVHGRFVFDDGRVAMQDVNFKFRGAPVKFSRGTVFLQDSGEFRLAVSELDVKDIRFDLDLRQKMPPLMQQFALRLDDGNTFRARGDLEIGWSGEPNVPAWCEWKNMLVVLDGNTVKTGIPLEHIQGQLERVRGKSNGVTFEVEGILNLESVSVLGQQITKVESPFSIKQGFARLVSVQGRFLKGDFLGEDCWIALDANPHYHGKLLIRGAQLREYALTVSGHQSYQGSIDARFDLNGWGTDVRNLQGSGEAHITQGDLGELPLVLRLAKNLPAVLTMPLTDRPRTTGKTAFDSADVVFTIAQGLTTFDPIKFTGNAFSLQGQGTMNPHGKLDLQLNVLLGRDRFHIPFFSDLTREASTPILIVTVRGTPSYPQYKIEPLPFFNELLKAVGRSRDDRQVP